jgi:hypothetical protein
LSKNSILGKNFHKQSSFFAEKNRHFRSFFSWEKNFATNFWLAYYTFSSHFGCREICVTTSTIPLSSTHNRRLWVHGDEYTKLFGSSMQQIARNPELIAHTYAFTWSDLKKVKNGCFMLKMLIKLQFFMKNYRNLEKLRFELGFEPAALWGGTRYRLCYEGFAKHFFTFSGAVRDHSSGVIKGGSRGKLGRPKKIIRVLPYVCAQHFENKKF